LIKSAPKFHPDLSEFDYSTLSERYKLHEIFTRPQDTPNTLKPDTLEKFLMMKKEDAIVLKDIVGAES